MHPRFLIVVQAADGRQRQLSVIAPTPSAAMTRAIRDAKRDAPIDSHGKASEWRILRVEER